MTYPQRWLNFVEWDLVRYHQRQWRIGTLGELGSGLPRLGAPLLILVFSQCCVLRNQFTLKKLRSRP